MGDDDIANDVVASIIIERPSDVEEGYSLLAPLVYHFGHKSPSENLQLYNTLVSQLADIVNMRCETNAKSMSTFLIHTGRGMLGLFILLSNQNDQHISLSFGRRAPFEY